MPTAQLLDVHETPLRLSARVCDDDPVASAILARIGPLKRNARLMVLAILANYKNDPDATLFYSRDRNFYASSATRRYYPFYYTYSAVLSAVAALAQVEFVDDIRTPPSPRATKRSRLRAGAPLKALLTRFPQPAVTYVENEPIVLRRAGARKTLIDYVETDQTRGMRADVQAHNAFLSDVHVCLDDGQEVVTVEGRRYDLSFKLFHRVFNGDFEHGGRWYGPTWQNLPKTLRPRLAIDGAATCEIDIRSCHPRLLCAGAGLALPFDDPGFDFYRLTSFDREEVKDAVKVLLNAPNARSARGALIQALHQRGCLDPAARAKSLSKAVRAAWPQLAPYWGSGIGVRLQRIDADICTRVQAELRAQGIPVLSIHDGFIVSVAQRRSLQVAMDTAMHEACNVLRDHPIAIMRPVKTLK